MQSKILLASLGMFIFTSAFLVQNYFEQKREGAKAVTGDAQKQNEIAYETINGITVPPEPDPELNNATLAGIDVNGNGVRDDVERWIERTYPESEKTRRVLLVMAREFGAALTYANKKDVQSVLLTKAKITDSIDCLWYIQSDDASEIRKLLFAQVLSTKERSLAYAEYSKYQGESNTNRSSNEFKAGCTEFDPDMLAN